MKNIQIYILGLFLAHTSLFLADAPEHDNQSDFEQAVENQQSQQKKELSNKEKFLEILGLSDGATESAIEYAYHKIVDTQHEKIESAQKYLVEWYNSQKFWHDRLSRENEINRTEYQSSENSVLVKKEFQGRVVTVHGRKELRFVEAGPFESSTHRRIGSFERYNQKSTDVVYGKDVCPSCYEKIKQAREAFEGLTGKKLEAVQLPQSQELNTENLDQQRIYNYISQPRSTLEGLQAIIQDERAKKNLEHVEIVILGENDPHVSQLSPEDQAKAQVALEERLERERPQRYADTSMNIAIGSGIVTAAALIVRAICLQE